MAGLRKRHGSAIGPGYDPWLRAFGDPAKPSTQARVFRCRACGAAAFLRAPSRAVASFDAPFRASSGEWSCWLRRVGA